MEILDCEQGSEAWFRAHMGIPSCSEFAKVMAKKGPKGGTSHKEYVQRAKYLRMLAGELITGQPREPEWFGNRHTDRGKEREDEARALYAFQQDVEPVQVGFIRNGICGGSPDSLVGDDGGLETIVWQVTPGPVEVTDPLNRVTIYDYCDPYAMANLPPNTAGGTCIVTPMAVGVTDPEGIATRLTWDMYARNLTQSRQIAQAGSGLADLVRSWTYSCSPTNFRFCNKPVTQTDARVHCLVALRVEAERDRDGRRGRVLLDRDGAGGPALEAVEVESAQDRQRDRVLAESPDRYWRLDHCRPA